jgi:pilus assembly protein CpaF
VPLHLDDAGILRLAQRILAPLALRLDRSSPMVDARLPDGSRVNAVVPPLAVDGPCLTIRRFRVEPVPLSSIAPPPLAHMLATAVGHRMNIVVSGGTGAGKTTLLNALAASVPATERVVTVEDAAELRLPGDHVVRLESRPASAEGRGEVTIRDLVRNALRMRPDRIILGEVRDAEAFDMLQAMNTGHDGSLTTVHANTPRDALMRVETMIAMGATNLPERAMRHQISSAIQIVVQQTRLSDGTRKVTSISEITGMEGDIITMQEIFIFEKAGVTTEGKVVGRFRATGVRPKCAERLKSAGIQLPASMFEGFVEVR